MSFFADAFDFTGRTVFVAGGSSGINLGIARAFAAQGAKVAVISRSAERVVAAVALLAADAGDASRAMGHAADVRDPAAVGAALAAVRERFGPIDVLISGAAGNFVAPALGMSPNGFKTVVDIDLLGSFNVLRLAHAHLRRPGASLIQISASQASRAMPLQVHVCAAKAGVDMLTRVLALEWGGDGIRINSIVPGPIEGTEGIRRLAPTEEAVASMTAQVPLRRFGRAEEIAHMALFLASPLASYITGTVIPVDGGLSLGGPRDLSAGLTPTRV
jgi:NAD(P)-dependent dehydrogenase (short-subunit alcohol dehydrogenase family)